MTEKELILPRLESGGRRITRRDAIVKGAVAGGLVWAAPTIISTPAWAAEGGGGTPRCQPTVTVRCARIYCCQGQKFFPGLKISVGPCRCDPNGPPAPPLPASCVLINHLVGIGECDTRDFVFYGGGTDCNPSGQPNDIVLAQGQWKCMFDLEPSTPATLDYEIFIGKSRSADTTGGGSISEVNDDCSMQFDLSVWAGGCPTDADPTGTGTESAYECLSYRVTFTWQQNTLPSICQGGYLSYCELAPLASSTPCDTITPPHQSPCGSSCLPPASLCTGGPGSANEEDCGPTWQTHPTPDPTP